MGLGLLLLPTLVFVCASGAAIARASDVDPTDAAAREKFFEQNVRPLLAESCYSCHSGAKQKGSQRRR